MKKIRETIWLLLFATQALAGATTSRQVDTIKNSTGGSALSVPSSGSSFSTDSNTLTLSNKTISGSSNTITNISLTAGVTGVLPSANVGLGRTINAQTGTSYTFALSDGSAAGSAPLATFNNASAITVTIPLNSSVAFPVGTQIDCVQLGAGKVTFSPTGGVTLDSASSNKSISAQYIGVTLIKIATDTWLLLGSLSA